MAKIYDFLEQACFETLASDPSPPTGGAARFYFNSTSKTIRFYDGTQWREVGTGSGSGEVNYVVNPSAASNLDGWVASGAGVTVARTVTGSELPRETITTTGIKITPVSGTTDYVRYRFQMGDADKGKKLKIQWAMKALSGYVSGDLVVEMWTNAASNYGGSYTQVTVVNEAIPASDCVFQTTFDTTTADYYEMRIRRTAGTTAIVLSDVVVGPGSLASVPAVSLYEESTSWTIGSTGTPPTAGGTTRFYRRTMRIGSEAEIRWEFSQSTAGSTGAGTYLLPFPSGITIDTSRLHIAVGDSQASCGYGTFSSSGLGTTGALAYANGDDAVSAVIDDQTSDDWQIFGDSYFALGNADINFAVIVRVPIAEWAADTVFTEQTAVEYAFNTNTGSGDNFTDFGYGPQGEPVPDITTSQVRRVRFKTPILPTDKIELQIRNTGDGSAGWVSAAEQLMAPQINGGTIFGYYIDNTAVTEATDIDITFAQYARDPNVDWATQRTNGYLYRVVKSSNPLSVGHNLVSQNNSGLVASAGQLKGTNTDDDAQAGNVGEILETILPNASAIGPTSTTPTDLVSKVLTPGDWDVQAHALWSGAGSTIAYLKTAVSETSATFGAEVATDMAFKSNPSIGIGTAETQDHWARVKVEEGTTKTVYAVVEANYSGGSTIVSGFIRATRRR